MTTFEELGLRPELVDALLSEGLEEPTPLQEDAIPVLRRAHNLVLAAGPGAGTLVAWGAALLDRLEAGEESPRALVLTPTAPIAAALAGSLGRLAASVGHRVAALGSAWARPERATLLVGTAEDVLDAAEGGDLSLGAVEALVVDQAEKLDALGGMERLERVLSHLPPDGQRVVTALPLSGAVRDFVERHVRRATTVPPRPAEGTEADPVPHRGNLRFRVIPEPREDGLPGTVAELLDDGARHVVVFTRNADRAADVGDQLALHGFRVGAPGDTAVPVWLGVDALEARKAAADAEGVVVVSCDAPVGMDQLDRRHGMGDEGVVLLLPREIPHLRDVARRTGYRLRPMPAKAPPDRGELAALRERLARAVEEEDVAAYMLVLEPLFDRFEPVQVAAAATALLRRKMPPEPEEPGGARERSRPPAWVRVFLSVGERDGLSPGDLLGAITGEADVPGDAVGKIEIRESHSLVDIQDSLARKVIRALNGTTIRGRAVRADTDRGPRTPRSGGRRPGGRGRG
jgi:ATP-dependent RNA helicase DeaD